MVLQRRLLGKHYGGSVSQENPGGGSFFFSGESEARGDVRKVSIESAHVYFADVSKNPNRNSFPSDTESTTSNSRDIYI